MLAGRTRWIALDMQASRASEVVLDVLGDLFDFEYDLRKVSPTALPEQPPALRVGSTSWILRHILLQRKWLESTEANSDLKVERFGELVFDCPRSDHGKLARLALLSCRLPVEEYPSSQELRAAGGKIRYDRYAAADRGALILQKLVRMNLRVVQELFGEATRSDEIEILLGAIVIESDHRIETVFYDSAMEVLVSEQSGLDRAKWLAGVLVVGTWDCVSDRDPRELRALSQLDLKRWSHGNDYSWYFLDCLALLLPEEANSILDSRDFPALKEYLKQSNERLRYDPKTMTYELID